MPACPISWSPDGGVARLHDGRAGRGRADQPGVALSGSNLLEEQPGLRSTRRHERRPAVGESVRYRIWATERGTLASVLIEDSPIPALIPRVGPRWPLSVLQSLRLLIRAAGGSSDPRPI